MLATYNLSLLPAWASNPLPSLKSRLYGENNKARKHLSRKKQSSSLYDQVSVTMDRSAIWIAWRTDFDDWTTLLATIPVASMLTATHHRVFIPGTELSFLPPLYPVSPLTNPRVQTVLFLLGAEYPECIDNFLTLQLVFCGVHWTPWCIFMSLSYAVSSCKVVTIKSINHMGHKNDYL